VERAVADDGWKPVNRAARVAEQQKAARNSGIAGPEGTSGLHPPDPFLRRALGTQLLVARGGVRPGDD
jgi:hypothetical protein